MILVNIEFLFLSTVINLNFFLCYILEIQTLTWVVPLLMLKKTQLKINKFGKEIRSGTILRNKLIIY